MKKILLAASALVMAGAINSNTKVEIQKTETPTENNTKAVTSERKRRESKKSVLDPVTPTLGDIVNISGYTSPFYNPTKSERVKNKLNRKRYNKNRNKHK